MILPGILILFLLGLCWGSFLNVLIYRLPRGMSIVKGRSLCPNCRKKISWFDNIPLISYLLLDGKCRWCQKPISKRYPLVEALAGLLLVLVYLFLKPGLEFNYQFIFNLLYWYSLNSLLMVIFFIDGERQQIPDEVLKVLFLTYFIYNLSFQNFFWFKNSFLAGFILFTFFLVVHKLTRGKGMGLGDVKFSLLIGLIFGLPQALLAVYFAFILGAIYGLILVIFKKAKLGEKIAFGPFLVIGCWLTFFGGGYLINFIRNFMLF